MSKKAYVFLAEGFEEIEALTPVDILRRAGIDCTTVSISDKLEVTGSHNITVKADILFSEGKFLDGYAIILPGGLPGTTNLGKHSGLKELIEKYNKENKLISAICAGPTIFANMGLLNGICATCYPSMTDKLTGAIVKDDKCVYDKNILTSRGMGTAMDFALKIVEILENKEVSDTIKNQVVYL